MRRPQLASRLAREGAGLQPVSESPSRCLGRRNSAVAASVSMDARLDACWCRSPCRCFSRSCCTAAPICSTKGLAAVVNAKRLLLVERDDLGSSREG